MSADVNAPDEREHDLSEDCWCDPVVTSVEESAPEEEPA